MFGGISGESRGKERQEASSSATSVTVPGRGAHSGGEERQGEPGEDGEARTAVGVPRPGDIDPGTETGARYKREDGAAE